MDILIGAAIIGLAIVVAGALFGRRGMHAPGGEGGRQVNGARRGAGLDEREAELERREQHLAAREREADALAARRARALESVAGMDAAEAEAALLADVEQQAGLQRARRLRQIEEETRRDADRVARSILATAMQRAAAANVQQATISVVQLPDDSMKGRVIGREGRNIRAFESVTGVDLIIDETPGAVVLSSFDGVRREVARRTLEHLIADGRIHPAKIEEAFYRSKSELESVIDKAGEDAAVEAGVPGLDAELLRTLGRLRFRTSYSQNVLAHSVECAQLAAMLAHELGADVAVARRAALLHDIGKALPQDAGGPHALAGADHARRHGEEEAVAHAMAAHHNEVEPGSVEAVIVQTADAISGARPGARGESLEQYVTRLRDLEQIAERHPGVDRVYAMQAGRDLRVIVEPEAISDDQAALLASEIAREIERDVTYPGQIKVTVIREIRAVDYAR